MRSKIQFLREISESDLIKLKDELKQIIESSDSVTMYNLRKKNIGIIKKPSEFESVDPLFFG
jgi:CRISPR/Cas system-associated endoribonuclease Cas2